MRGAQFVMICLRVSLCVWFHVNATMLNSNQIQIENSDPKLLSANPIRPHSPDPKKLVEQLHIYGYVYAHK